jgi:hypothetical protein
MERGDRELSETPLTFHYGQILVSPRHAKQTEPMVRPYAEPTVRPQKEPMVRKCFLHFDLRPNIVTAMGLRPKYSYYHWIWAKMRLLQLDSGQNTVATTGFEPKWGYDNWIRAKMR